MGFMSNPAGEGGSFKVFVKFNAKAGRFYTKKDEKDAPEFEVANMTAVFDMENLKTGWFLFAAGQAPSKHYDAGLDTPAPKPGENYKRGFELDLFSETNLLGVREFASTAGVVIEAMNELYDHWNTERGKNAGKLPVVKCVGVHPVTGVHGTNFKPQFEIVAWTDRPAELSSEAAAKTSEPAAQQETAAPSAAQPKDDEVVF